jgi:hypothetical protein
MGWCGLFLVPKLKLGFYLRKINENDLYSSFDFMNQFFDRHDKLREDIEHVQYVAEESKSFYAKTTSKMFNIVDTLGLLPEKSDSVFLLYFLHKKGFEIKYQPEDR